MKKNRLLGLLLFILLWIGAGCSKQNTGKEQQTAAPTPVLKTTPLPAANKTLITSTPTSTTENINDLPTHLPGWKNLLIDMGKNPETITADQLNTEGFNLYKEKKYAPAAALFQEALNKEPDHPFAGYNLACMLSLMLGEGKEVDTDKILSLILTETVLNPQKIEKVRQDNDLTPIKNNKAFQYILNNNELLTILYKHFKKSNNFVAIDSSNHFNELSDEPIIKITEPQQIILLPSSRINTITRDDKNILIFEQYIIQPPNYEKMANAKMASPISADFNDFSSIMTIILYDSALLEILDTEKFYNEMNETFYADKFIPIKSVKAFGEKSFYISYSSFSSNFIEYSIFFTIKNSSLKYSRPWPTEVENLSGLDFGTKYDFTTLRESDKKITIKKLVYNNEDEPINEISAKYKKEKIEILLSW